MPLFRINREEPASAPEQTVPSVASEKPAAHPFLEGLHHYSLKAILWTGSASILIAVAGFGAGVGGLAAWLEEAPRIEEFDGYNPPESTIILDRNGNRLASLFEQRRRVVSLTQMTPALPQGLVAIEDERFRNHWGIDPIGIARAFVVNVSRGRFSQGASTITQQTARNLVERIGKEKTAKRKLLEVLVSVQMERSYSKDQILEVYLNQIYLGSGNYGVEAAAQTYFGKSASDLTLAEAATLSGLPQLPERYSPLNNPESARTRRDQVLNRMLTLGYISEAQFNSAIISPMATVQDRGIGTRAPYFVDAVRRIVAGHGELGADSLQTAGWLIETTVDPTMQEVAERVLREGLETEEAEWVAGRQARYQAEREKIEHDRPPAASQVRMGRVVRFFRNSIVVELPGKWRGDLTIPIATSDYFQQGAILKIGDGVDVEVSEVDHPRALFRGRLLPAQRLQGALVCLDRKTAEVRALVGGRRYSDPGNNGYFNRAMLARRQAGSTMKPFFFAAALEQGLFPETLVLDTQISFPDGYTPRNYDGEFKGAVSLQESLEQSRNIPTIRVAQIVGLKDAIRYVERFQRIGAKPWAMPLEWSVVLGTTNVTPLELAGAYQAIANDGVSEEPRLVLGARNAEGRTAPGFEAGITEYLMGADAAAGLHQMMAGVLIRGTGHRLMALIPEGLQHQVHGKSGTTNDNRDAWFAGFAGDEVVVVWIGFDQSIPLAPGRTGGKAAGPIWARYLADLWRLRNPGEPPKLLKPEPSGLADAEGAAFDFTDTNSDGAVALYAPEVP